MDDAPELTAVIVTRDRVVDVVACVESLLASRGARLEIVVVENGATDAVRTALAGVVARDPRVRRITVPAMSPSLARNEGSREARGELVFFFDDDVLVPPSVPAAAVALLRARPEIGIAGGPNLTPEDDPELAQLFGVVLASRFGTGIASPRYATRPAGPARESDLILCNLVVRRALLDGGLEFPRLFGGEENVLMGQAESMGVGMFYDPSLTVHHRRRRTLAGHLEQVHRYGVGRANAMFSAPRTFRAAYLVPSAFVVYLAILPVLATVEPLALAPLVLYAGLAASAAILGALASRRVSFLPLLVVLYPMTHVAYGLGVIRRSAQLAFRGPTGDEHDARGGHAG